MTNAPDSLDTLRKHAATAMAVIAERTDGYVEGREFYDGTRAEVGASSAIRKLIRKTNKDKHSIPIAAIPVDALMDKVELQGFSVEGNDDATELLASVLDGNNFEEESDDWQRQAGYFGDYYVVVTPTELDESGTASASDMIEIVGKSPLNTVVVYDAETQRRPLYGFTSWTEGGRVRAILYYDDCSVHLITRFGSSLLEGVRPEMLDLDPEDPTDEDSARVEHPGGRMLLHHIPIDGRPYGTPVHVRAYGPQESITKIHMINMINVDAQGLGARWALQDPAAEIDDTLDEDFGEDGPDDISTVGPDGQTKAVSGRVRSVPGEIAFMKGIKAVGQFDAAQSSEFTSNEEWYIRIAAVLTGTPLFEFDLSGEQPSGEARRRAESRINRHARKVQRSLARTYSEVGRTILALAGFDASATPVSVAFQPVETATDTEGFELIALKIKTGVPVQQAFREAGYEAEQIAEWFPDDAANVTYDSLSTLTTSLQQLGQAKTLGVIGDEDIHRLLPSIITAAISEGVAPTGEEDGVEPEATDQSEVNADVIKSKADALGVLVRSGADATQSANMLGLGDLSFPNVPVTIRLPEEDAVGLEGSASAPSAPSAPGE